MERCNAPAFFSTAATEPRRGLPSQCCVNVASVECGDWHRPETLSWGLRSDCAPRRRGVGKESRTGISKPEDSRTAWRPPTQAMR